MPGVRDMLFASEVVAALFYVPFSFIRFEAIEIWNLGENRVAKRSVFDGFLIGGFVETYSWRGRGQVKMLLLLTSR